MFELMFWKNKGWLSDGNNTQALIQNSSSQGAWVMTKCAPMVVLNMPEYSKFTFFFGNSWVYIYILVIFVYQSHGPI